MLVIGDVAIGPTILFGGLALGLALLIPIVLIEGLVLWRLGWAAPGRALLDALAANLASTLFGLAFFALFFSASFQCRRGPAADGQLAAQLCDWTISPILWFAAMAGLSVLIEGGVLLLLRRRPARQTWAAALAANLASYLLLGLLALAGALSLP